MENCLRGLRSKEEGIEFSTGNVQGTVINVCPEGQKITGAITSKGNSFMLDGQKITIPEQTKTNNHNKLEIKESSSQDYEETILEKVIKI